MAFEMSNAIHDKMIIFLFKTSFVYEISISHKNVAFEAFALSTFMEAFRKNLVLTLNLVRLFVISVTCPNIESIQYVDITTSTRPPYEVGTVANFTCDEGFKGVGKSSIICMGNGRWSGSSPYCRGKSRLFCLIKM